MPYLVLSIVLHLPSQYMLFDYLAIGYESAPGALTKVTSDQGWSPFGIDGAAAATAAFIESKIRLEILKRNKIDTQSIDYADTTVLEEIKIYVKGGAS